MKQEKLPLARLRQLSEHMPFNRSLGLRVAKTHEDGVTIEIPIRDDMRNLAGVLHGGVSATIADAAVGIAVLRHFGGERACTTVDLKINYFRPISEGKVVARSKLIRVGNHLAVGTVELKDAAGNLAGFATATYMLLEWPARIKIKK
ncbi:MAG: PaaI family thioesterase [Bryobacterales bacterium]|nr:PaaI family thioesterase [Bryobacterales bacterium]